LTLVDVGVVLPDSEVGSFIIEILVAHVASAVAVSKINDGHDGDNDDADA